MADGPSSESPLETAASTVGGRTAEAFEVLGNDTRLAILLALWEAQDPGLPRTEPSTQAVSFSELRDRVGVRDSGQFNYHLDKLIGTFIEQTDEGYTLTTAAEQILRAVFAGTLADASSFEGEPIDTECYLCGGSTVIDYSDDILTWRCTSCEGAIHQPDAPPGLIGKLYRPPVGLENRTPQEFHRYGNVWDRHRLLSMMEGVCPDCSGAVTGYLDRCEAHDTLQETVCEHCGGLWEIDSLFVCEVCKSDWRVAGWAPIFTEVAVLAFCHDHGLDAYALFDEDAHGVYYDALEMTVQAEEPLEFETRLELEGDRLRVTINDEARVIDVTEEGDEPA